MNTSIRRRLLGPCARFPDGPDSVVVDVGALVRRVLLFETYILDSYRLLEVPRLISAFGSSGFMTLLRSGVLKIKSELFSVADMGQARGPRSLPLGSFELNVIKPAQPDKYLHDALQNVHRVGGLPLKEAIKVKREIVAALAPSPPTTGNDALANTRLDLARPYLLRAALVRSARVRGLSLRPEDIVARMVAIDAKAFRMESNLGVLGLDEGNVQLVLQGAVFALSNTNFLIEAMRNHQALSGVIGDDAEFLGQKLDFLLQEIAPQTQERRFDRVIQLAGLPDISTEADNHFVDVQQLLKVRETRECAEFREWLGGLDGMSDSEVTERVRGFKALVDGLVQSKGGKALRLLVSSLAGLIPEHGPAVGLAAGALDMFVIDKVFSQSGPAAFVNSHYSSLFRKDL